MSATVESVVTGCGVGQAYHNMHIYIR